MPLIGKQDEICVKVALCLGKYINPVTKKIHWKAYPMIAEELAQFGVSAKYVGTVWRKHRLDILDTANRDIITNLKHKLGARPPRTVPVEELHRRVTLAPFWYRKCKRVLSNCTGIPKSTLHNAMKGGLLKVSKSIIRRTV